MTFYKNIFEIIDNQIPNKWNELRKIVDGFVRTEPEVWKLPVSGYFAANGQGENIEMICAALACSYISIMLVDDILDEDQRGWHNHLNIGQVVNIALVLNAYGVELINQISTSDEIKFRLALCIQEMMSGTGFGQYLDSRNFQSEEKYWRMINEKSAPFFIAALKVGAILAGADEKILEFIGVVGCYYGEILQIHDDLKDAFVVPASPDWLFGRSSLPILFASLVEHPDQEAFIELMDQVEDTNSLEDAQRILIKSGAASYCMHEIMKRSEEITGLVKQMEGINQPPLLSLFDSFIDPVEAFLKELSGDQESIKLVNLPAA